MVEWNDGTDDDDDVCCVRSDTHSGRLQSKQAYAIFLEEAEALR